MLNMSTNIRIRPGPISKTIALLLLAMLGSALSSQADQNFVWVNTDPGLNFNATLVFTDATIGDFSDLMILHRNDYGPGFAATLPVVSWTVQTPVVMGLPDLFNDANTEAWTMNGTMAPGSVLTALDLSVAGGTLSPGNPLLSVGLTSITFQYTDVSTNPDQPSVVSMTDSGYWVDPPSTTVPVPDGFPTSWLVIFGFGSLVTLRRILLVGRSPVA